MNEVAKRYWNEVLGLAPALDEPRHHPQRAKRLKLRKLRAVNRDQGDNSSAVSVQLRRQLSPVLCFIAAGLILAGSVIPYGSACDDCRVIAPYDAAVRVWLPSAIGSFAALAIALACGTRLAVSRAGDRFVAGFVIGAGVLTIGYFLAYGVHFDAPFGGVFGLGGLVGMLGGAMMVAAGWLYRRVPEAPATYPTGADPSTPSNGVSTHRPSRRP